MFTSPLEALFRSADQDLITEVFVIAILAAFLFAVGLAVARRARRFVAYAPALLTTLGILGTFTGIFCGLLNFDTAHIDTSIPALLAGMKMAFLTSVLGIMATVLFKVIEATLPVAKEVVKRDEVTPRDVYEAISSQGAELRALAKAIGGETEGSLVGQVKLMRSDLRDFQSQNAERQREFAEKLWAQLRDFADMMSRSATEQVINALKEVIVEFNNRLTEQFGDNFKRLDESVKKLVDWQAEYRKQLEEMIDLYGEGVQAIDATRVAVEGIRSETGRIPEDMRALAGVLEVNQHQIAELNRHLEAFSEMRDAAVAAVPQIQHQVEDVATQLREGAERMHKVMVEGATEFAESVTRTNAGLTSMAGEIANTSESIAAEVEAVLHKLQTSTDRIQNGVATIISDAMAGAEAAARDMSTSTQRTSEDILEAVRVNADKAIGSVEASIEAALKNAAEGINKQFDAANEATRRTLEAAFSDMGSALASVVEHIRTVLDRSRSRVA